MRDINQSEFQEAVKEGFTLVDVYGDNCTPCVFLHQVLEIIEKEYPFVNIVRLKSEDNPQFCQQYSILGVPTLFFIKDGEIKERKVGALPADEIMEIAGEYLY